MKGHQTSVTGCSVHTDRPGIIQAFIQPTKMNDQLNPTAKKTPIMFTPTGRNDAGTMKWVASVMRPGIALPTIAAKRAPASVKNQVK